ncbi:Hsp70 family protein [Scytonema sp. UIC 10036]|uniref:WG repeat-containing protein n=1 Tax=Scytonema sp. UIC 10036 TaxID=2304196 RepID=UPI0012DA90EE|nr:WG repeat-containing protein [Scytonema sp. UIC 10036]MUG96842.1 Hsp70 family protein [Scytonema sp. UIC 10036]
MRLGIDFGTCYSSAALLLDGSLTAIENPLQPGYCFASSVFLTAQGEILVGQAAENSRQQDPQRYRREFKRDLGSSDPYTLGNRPMLPEELVTEVIRKLKTEAEKVVKAWGEKFLNDVIITVPATYQAYKRQIMQEAGIKAGFTQVELLEEPIAAAIYYSHHSHVREGEIILVYDLGGGTFDATLIQKQNSGYKALAMPRGLTNCGGTDFDRAIYQHLKTQCSASLRQQLDAKEAWLARAIVSDLCRDLKHQLSEAQEATIYIPMGLGAVEPYSLTRQAFNSMIAPLIDETIDCCDQLLRSAEIKWQQVDEVLLVGGSCRIPYVREVVERKLGRDALLVDKPELAVCLGAAIYEMRQPSRLQDPTSTSADSQVVANVPTIVEIKERSPYIEQPEKPIIIPDQSTPANITFEVLATVKVNDKWGYIDRTGKFVIPPQFDYARPFFDGLARVEVNGKYGYIDSTGNFAILPLFDYTDPWSFLDFSEGRATVKVNDKWGHIDRTGKFVIPPQFDDADSFSEGLAAVRMNGKYGYIDSTGKFVTQLIFDNVYSFSEELAAVGINGKYGYIDSTGKFVIQPVFDRIDVYPNRCNGVTLSRGLESSFSEGLGRVKMDSKYGYIDSTGKIIISHQFDFASQFYKAEKIIRTEADKIKTEVIVKAETDIITEPESVKLYFSKLFQHLRNKEFEYSVNVSYSNYLLRCVANKIENFPQLGGMFTQRHRIVIAITYLNAPTFETWKQFVDSCNTNNFVDRLINFRDNAIFDRIAFYAPIAVVEELNSPLALKIVKEKPLYRQFIKQQESSPYQKAIYTLPGIYEIKSQQVVLAEAGTWFEPIKFTKQRDKIKEALMC